MRAPRRGPSDFDTDEQRWAVIQPGTREADGRLVHAVCTTGAYGRPSSSARVPNRENVNFSDSAEDAESAGCRADRRTVGDQTTAASRRTKRVTQEGHAVALRARELHNELGASLTPVTEAVYGSALNSTSCS